MRRDRSADLLERLTPAGPARRRLYEAAHTHTSLATVDYLTIRDLAERAQVGEDLALEAALVALFLGFAEGSLCTPLDPGTIARRLDWLDDDLDAGALVTTFLANLDAGRYERLIGAAGPDGAFPFLPIICRTGDRDPAKRHLYFHKHLRSETDLKERLRARLAHRRAYTAEDVAHWQAIVEEVTATKPVAPGGAPVQFEGEHALVLWLALLGDFLIITGGPGTGKTSLVVAILRCLARAGNAAPERIRLAAPTGRAAQRMTDAVHGALAHIRNGPAPADRALLEIPEAATLHRLLGYHPSCNDFTYHRGRPLPADVLIVDESSMVDVALMAHLFDALGPETKVVLLGDEDQLPSVDAGAVLADLVPRDEGTRLRAETATLLEPLCPGLTSEEAAKGGTGVALLKTSQKGPPAVSEGDQAPFRGLAPFSGGKQVPDPLPERVPDPDGRNCDVPFSTEQLPSPFPPSPSSWLPFPEEKQAPVTGSDPEEGLLLDRLVRLRRNFRSNAAIVRLAEAVRKGEDVFEDGLLPEVASGARTEGVDIDWDALSGCQWIDADALSEADRLRVVDSWIERHYFESREGRASRSLHDLVGGSYSSDAEGDTREALDEIFARVRYGVILTVLRNGPCGCRSINAHIARKFGARFEPAFAGRLGLFPGAPVMVTRNDYAKRLFNGDVGVVLRHARGGWHAFFERMGDHLEKEHVSFPLDALPAHEGAFALTVHKSQGSEWERVLLVMPDDAQHRLLTREIVYTGLTRARSLAAVLTRRDVLCRALATRIERVSGIDFQ